MKHKRFFRALVLCLAILLSYIFSACSSAPAPENREEHFAYAEPEEKQGQSPDSMQPEQSSPKTETWTLSRIEEKLAGRDPIEGFNRCIFSFNDAVMIYVVRPIGWAYCSLIPKPVMECIDNVCDNLSYPARLITCLGRAEWGGAGDETCRFFINTTLGIAGIFDPAKHWFHFYSTGSNFGQMFASWGIGPGCTLILPFSPAVNIRDNVGVLFDSVFSIKTYLPFTGWTAINSTLLIHPSYESLLSGSRDRYKIYRNAMVLNREIQQDLWTYKTLNALRRYEKHPEEAPPPKQPKRESIQKPADMQGIFVHVDLMDYLPQNTYNDSIRVLLFQPQKANHYWYLPLSAFNSDFSEKAYLRSIRIYSDAEKSRYLFWDLPSELKDQEEESGNRLPEKLAVILPGIGSAYNCSSALAMAELMNNNGYRVVTVDSAFTWRFMESAGRNSLPGFAPRDAANMREYIAAILLSLKEDGMIEDPEITLIGWSFGGIHTLHIAALEEKEKILNAKRYIALNPPADLDFALRTADSLSNCSDGMNFQEVRDLLVDAGGKIVFYKS